MYLIFETEQEAKERNVIEAVRRKHDLSTTNEVWSRISSIESGERNILNVEDGEGLSSSELAKCVEVLPV